MNIRRIIKEEIDDFDWIREIGDDLIPDNSYLINSENGVYWSPETFVGKYWDNDYNMEIYKFKDIDSDRVNHSMSAPYVKSLIKSGKIKPYDPNWSILDDINFSDDINDVDKGNFVIYFEGGVYLDDTIELQGMLFEKGFSFSSKSHGELLTNEDFSEKIQLFESVNWDISNNTYKSMPPDMRDRKKMLLVKVKEDHFLPTTKNKDWKNQEIFRTAIDHDVIVINGNKYIR